MTTIPAALDALTGLFAAALPGVQVTNGPTTVANDPDANGLARGVVVGWMADRASVEVDVQRPGAGLRLREQYQVNCTMWAISGETDPTVCRDAIFPMFTAATEAVRTDHTLGGVVMNAVPLLADFDQQQSGDGAFAQIEFTIFVDAF